MTQKILIFKIGAIGDVLMTTPMVRQLRKNFPNAKIDYLVGKQASKVLEGNKYLDEIMVFDEKIFFKKQLMPWIKLKKKIKNKEYDTVFVLDRHWFFNFTSRLFGAKRRIGFSRDLKGNFLTDKVRYGNETHDVYNYLSLLSVIGKVDYNDFSMDLFISREDEKLAKKLVNKKSYVVMVNTGGSNPGEKGGIRKMPDKLFRDIVNAVSKKYYVVFLGAPEEKDYYRKFLNSNCKNLCGKTSIKQSAAIMKHAKYVITTDSGPMHIAAAVNKNIISLFGPTSPERKAPLWKESIAIWKDKELYDRDYEMYGKKPKNKKYMEKIKVADVIRHIK